MNQFEVWRLDPGPGAKGRAELVGVLQHSLLRDLDTCVVAPLRPIDELPALGRLRPQITVERRRYRLIVDRLATVRRPLLSKRAGTAEAAAESIRRAMDELFYGV